MKIYHQLYSNGNGSDVSTTFDTGLGMSAALGYGKATGLRLEGELSYSTADIGEFNSGGTIQDDTKGEVVTMTVAFNALYGFDVFGFNPYVGGGLGLSRYHVDAAEGSGFVSIEDNQVAPVAQFMLGVDKAITERVSLGLGYKYTISTEFAVYGATGARLDDNFESHSVAARLRYSF